MKEGLRESKGTQKQEISVVCEISQPKIAPYENGHPLRNNFAATRCPLRNQGLAAKWAIRCKTISQPHNHPLRKFSQLRNTPLAHECHFTAAKSPRPSKTQFRSPRLILQLQNPLQNTLLAQSAISQPMPPFRSCENGLWLRNHLWASKWLRNHLQAVK